MDFPLHYCGIKILHTESVILLTVLFFSYTPPNNNILYPLAKKYTVFENLLQKESYYLPTVALLEVHLVQ
jgi:hypothetical protein